MLPDEIFNHIMSYLKVCDLCMYYTVCKCCNFCNDYMCLDCGITENGDMYCRNCLEFCDNCNNMNTNIYTGCDSCNYKACDDCGWTLEYCELCRSKLCASCYNNCSCRYSYLFFLYERLP